MKRKITIRWVSIMALASVLLVSAAGCTGSIAGTYGAIANKAANGIEDNKTTSNSQSSPTASTVKNNTNSSTNSSASSSVGNGTKNTAGTSNAAKASGSTTPSVSGNKSSKYHIREVSPDKPLRTILSENKIKARDSGINLYVDLKTRTLQFRYNDKVLKSYSIAAGENTEKGDKVKEGDRRTPHGTFYICEKRFYNPPKEYIGTRFMLLSYPNREAAERGLWDKLISTSVYKSIINAINQKKTPPQDTPLGSAIGIHGGAEPSFAKDWTWGCIGLYTQDVEEISAFVRVGTKVTIE